MRIAKFLNSQVATRNRIYRYRLFGFCVSWLAIRKRRRQGREGNRACEASGDQAFGNLAARQGGLVLDRQGGVRGQASQGHADAGSRTDVLQEELN